MGDFKIEKNIPIITRMKYRFREMEVGDSVFFEDLNEGVRVGNAGRNWGRHNNRRFSQAREGKGMRIWRVK